MKALTNYIYVYMLALLRPWRMHRWIQGADAPWEPDLPIPSLAESLGVSWVMAVMQGLAKILLANLLIQGFMLWQSEGGIFMQLLQDDGALLPYYVLLFSTSLDLIFFPIITLVTVEFWNFVIRLFGRLLGMGEERHVIAQEITTVALSANFFLIVPILGMFLQKVAWFFLMYVGLRERLQASRSLSLVILAAPAVMLMMVLGFSFLAIFYLIAL